MANTTKLNIVTDFIIKELSIELNKGLKKRKVPVGRDGIMKQFAAVSEDKSVVFHICHHSGKTSGGKSPVGKINGLFSKCFLLEKAQAKRKAILFTNEEFFNIFKEKSKGLLDDIELKLFKNLPLQMRAILDEVYLESSKEMSR